MARSEAEYQRGLIKRLESMFPGCFIIINDPQNTQGLPDILMLYGCSWVMLEVKRSESSPARPNQPYYIDLFGQMSYAAFIYPENESVVLNDLKFAFGA